MKLQMAPAVQNHDHCKTARRTVAADFHRGLLFFPDKKNMNNKIHATTVIAITAITLFVSYELIVADKTATISWILGINMVRNFASVL